MKKKIIILITVILLSLMCVYGVFCVKSKDAWNKVIEDYINENNKAFIYKGGLIDFISDKEIEQLPLVVSGDIFKENVIKDRNEANEVVNDFSKALKGVSLSYVRTVNEGYILYGLILDDSFLYIYDNDFALVNSNGKYYAYRIRDIEKLNSLYDELAFDFNGDPYFRMK